MQDQITFFNTISPSDEFKSAFMCIKLTRALKLLFLSLHWKPKTVVIGKAAKHDRVEQFPTFSLGSNVFGENPIGDPLIDWINNLLWLLFVAQLIWFDRTQCDRRLVTLRNQLPRTQRSLKVAQKTLGPNECHSILVKCWSCQSSCWQPFFGSRMSPPSRCVGAALVADPRISFTTLENLLQVTMGPHCLSCGLNL